MKPLRALLCALPIAAACRSDVAFVALEPLLVVEPGALDFGPVVAGEETGALELVVANAGSAELVVDLALDGVQADRFELPGEDHLALAPDEQVPVVVTFSPAALGDVEATLVVSSNDVLHQLLPVRLTGVGRAPYTPEIELVPGGVLDFGTVPVGEEAVGFVEVRNVGDADLVLGTLTQQGAGTFRLEGDYSGTTIAPGQGRPLLVTFAPIQGGGDSGLLVIPSNDADEPQVEVPLEANGGGSFAYPTAVIDCPGQVALAGPVTVHLDGSASSDPGGLPLDWAWTIVRRPDAADPSSAPTPVDGPETEVRLDAAGVWEVQLQVTNSDGVPSAPTKCVLDAVPLDELHVELAWGGATSDLDLHLATEGAGLFEVPGDVSFCNPTPAWGGAGVEDDPRLDLDDDDGFGPENINVPSPATGAYPVRVHLFDDADDGEVTATVTVFTYGERVWSGSRVLRRNQVWEVGQVNWPDGTFGAAQAAAWDAGGTRSCR